MKEKVINIIRGNVIKETSGWEPDKVKVSTYIIFTDSKKKINVYVKTSLFPSTNLTVLRHIKADIKSIQ